MTHASTHRPIDQESALSRELLTGADRTRFWRDPRWDDLECLSARFVRHVYAPHVHDTYALGVIEAGVEHYRYRGVEHAVGAGEFVILDPHELHDGRPGEAGYRYRMMYPSPRVMTEIAEEMTDRPAGTPHFRHAKSGDPVVVRAIQRVHRLLEAGAEKLESDGAFLEAMALLIRWHGASGPPADLARREDKAVARVCEAMEETLEQDWSLDELAKLVDFSRYRLIRSFRRTLGVTPHAYRISRRVIRAKRCLAAGMAPAEAAAAAGFCDQAHLTRTFKSVVGVTPAAFRAACVS